MKSTVKCDSEFFLRHMARKLEETGTGWTAMDAYLQMVETCNRCPMMECPGMLSSVLDGDHTVRQPYGDLVPLTALTEGTNGHIQHGNDPSLESLQALAEVVGGEDDEPALPSQEGQPVATGERSALALLMGWRWNGD